MGGMGSGRRPLDLADSRFGRLVARSRIGTGIGKQKSALWLCTCDCGGETVVSAVRLVRSPERDCGCVPRTAHRPPCTARTVPDHKSRPEFGCWCGMWSRCTWPGHKHWKYYGGRGITVCARWCDFAAFLLDLGPRPSLAHSLDRIDGDGNYEPGNVRWTTWDVQAKNRRPFQKKSTPSTERPCEPRLPRDPQSEGIRHDAANGCGT